MKRVILFCCVCCLAFFGYAKHDVAYICQGDTYSWNLSGYYSSDDTLVYVSGPTDWIEFSQSTQYDTVIGNIILLSPSADKFYQIISVNGVNIDMTECPMYLTIHVKTAPTISIPPDLVHHVTCPDGYIFPYMDGSFHVSLDDSVRSYAWVRIQVDTPFLFSHICYDTVTLTGLKSGIYHIISYGINGCAYHDSVVIEQPEPWVDIYDSLYTDTVCFGQSGCLSTSIYGGTPPYNFTWFYFSDTGQVFMEDTTRLICGAYSGYIYGVYMYDSRGCKALGMETDYIYTYLYEYIEDSISLTVTNPKICYGGVDTLHAQSIGEETNYIWHVGDLSDSTNYSTWIETDSVYIAEYLTPPMIESAWVSVDFYDQHNCVTHDSVWIEVYNPDVSLTVDASEVYADSAFVVYVSPPGGDLYIDDALLISSIPSVFTVYTDGISVGPHILKYAGTFGGSMGLSCEDEISIPIQVETNPFVPNWEYEISIYPNPASTTLNLSSTGTSDFELSVLDITGKVIKTEKMLDQTFTFDVSDLASGMYMLRLVSQDGASKVVKFVKR